jgi:hypothetical protein
MDVCSLGRQESKTAASQREAAVRNVQAVSSVEQNLQASSMVASNAIDVGTRDAEIIQLAIVESGELTNGLLISCPLLESLADVHLKSPFRLQGYI